MAEYITELSNDIAKSCPDLVENGCGNDNCVACLAFKLIGLGYKKQDNTADVVPKSEYDAVVSAVDNSTQYFLKLHDDYQEAKREVEEYKHNWQKIHDSYTADCIEHYNKGRTEVAREIFAYIENAACKKENEDVIEFVVDILSELKKKYTEGQK